MYAEDLPSTISLLTLVLTAEANFLSKHGQTDTHTNSQMQLKALPIATRMDDNAAMPYQGAMIGLRQYGKVK